MGESEREEDQKEKGTPIILKRAPMSFLRSRQVGSQSEQCLLTTEHLYAYNVDE